MENVRLIQRLRHSTGNLPSFAFGGGKLFGGISREAVEVLKNIFDFDYMGAAQFEHGAVPAALLKIADYSAAGKAHTSSVKLARDVHFICEQGLEQDVEKVIRQLAEDERKLGLLAPCLLREVLEVADSYYAQRYAGWLELNNGFMFFVDEAMYRNTLVLFGILNQLPKSQG